MLPIALVSCDHQLVWTFKLDAIDESVVRSVRAVISRGPCAGPPGACAQPELASIAYQDDFPADAAGTGVPTLDRGEYCFYGFARNPACAIVAVGCEPVELPEGARLRERGRSVVSSAHGERTRRPHRDGASLRAVGRVPRP